MSKASLASLVGDMYIAFGSITLLRRFKPGEEVATWDALKVIRRDFEAVEEGRERISFV
jgi:hypothetical protein